MNNKALKKYIEEKYDVKIIKIKSKLDRDYYVISKLYMLDFWSTAYELTQNYMFEKLSEILDYLKEQER